MRIRIETYIHIDSPTLEAGYTLESVIVSASVGKNPFYPDEDEPKYTIGNLKVINRGGRDITMIVEDWEFARLQEELFEAYAEAAEAAEEARAQEQIDTYLFSRQTAEAV